MGKTGQTDPITLEIIRNRLESIAIAMQHTLLRSAVSVILKEGEDGSTGIYALDGTTICQSRASGVHLATMPFSVRAVTEVYPIDQMKDGDSFIINDPYNGGTHLPDVIMVKPVFYKSQPVAMALALGHQEDIGGQEPASMSANSRDLFQEGLVIPPSPWTDAGEPVGVTRNFIRHNVRYPETVFGDLEAQAAACATAARGYLKMIDTFGLETVQAAQRDLEAQTEVRVRTGIEKIPDGTYEFEDVTEGPQPSLRRNLIKVKVTVAGNDIHVDFDGTSPELDWPVNVNFSNVVGLVVMAIRCLTDPYAPLNDGANQAVHVAAPDRTLFSPQRPAPIALRAQPSQRAFDVIIGALAQAIPEQATGCQSGGTCVTSFNGVDETGKQFGSSDLTTGGFGARAHQDGIDHLEGGGGNCRTPPVESWEAHYPVRIVRCDLITDSGGAGKYRGGLGVRREFEILKGPVQSCHRHERDTAGPWGVFGGQAGAPFKTYIRRKGGDVCETHAKAVLVLQQGDRLTVETAGGGGYGDPLERDPESVLADVLDRKVSLAAAKGVYGVIFTADVDDVDLAATASQRQELSRIRGPITWTFDRGPDGKDNGLLDPTRRAELAQPTANKK